MDLLPPLELVARKLAESCERVEAEYALIGGLAAGAYGSSRPTYDVDACVGLGSEEAARIETLLAELQVRGFRLNVEALRRRAERGRGILFLWIGRVRLDVMLRKGDGYWEDALRNRRRANVRGCELWVASPEDVIVLKLAAWREKDIEVVREVARAQYRRLDLARLRGAAAKLACKAPDLPAHVEAVIADAAEIDRLASLPDPDEAS
jgi:hypothetical protein